MDLTLMILNFFFNELLISRKIRYYFPHYVEELVRNSIFIRLIRQAFLNLKPNTSFLAEIWIQNFRNLKTEIDIKSE